MHVVVWCGGVTKSATHAAYTTKYDALPHKLRLDSASACAWEAAHTNRTTWVRKRGTAWVRKRGMGAQERHGTPHALTHAHGTHDLSRAHTATRSHASTSDDKHWRALPHR